MSGRQADKANAKQISENQKYQQQEKERKEKENKKG